VPKKNAPCASSLEVHRNSVPDPDADPLVRDMDPDPDSFYHPAKIVRKNLYFYCFVTSFGLFIFEK
jgi:hypothetical protein